MTHPKAKQLAIANILETQGIYLQETLDLDDPIHISNIDKEIKALEFNFDVVFTQDEIKRLRCNLVASLTFIRSIKN